jgi:hypothetical protein
MEGVWTAYGNRMAAAASEAPSLTLARTAGQGRAPIGRGRETTDRGATG